MLFQVKNRLFNELLVDTGGIRTPLRQCRCHVLANYTTRPINPKSSTMYAYPGAWVGEYTYGLWSGCDSNARPPVYQTGAAKPSELPDHYLILVQTSQLTCS